LVAITPYVLVIWDPKRNVLRIQKEPQMAELTIETADETATERLPQWELAECTCPDYCERDHERD
jgi:hypothetical protein